MLLETGIHIYQINTDKLSHVLLSHHFIENVHRSNMFQTSGNSFCSTFC